MIACVVYRKTYTSDGRKREIKTLFSSNVNDGGWILSRLLSIDADTVWRDNLNGIRSINMIF